MPISALQAKILKQISANRSPESHLAGATVLNRADESPRFSQDPDLFHDAAESVAISAERDCETLICAGYDVEWLMRRPAFYRAIIRVGKEELIIEWAQDSAFRFFPLEQDPVCGFRLHTVDAATNKLLALAGRSEVRDLVDILYLDQSYLSLGSLCWAACGKDAGYTPDFLLEQANRHTAYGQVDLDRLALREPLEMPELKQEWLRCLEKARTLVAHLPADEIGCLYLDQSKTPVCPDPSSDQFPALIRHRGSVGGAWPVIRESN
jgi:hypothetical protein